MLNRELDLPAKAKLYHSRRDPAKLLKLNLGSGDDWMVRGIINIDCRNLSPPDGVIFLRADVRDLAGMFKDGGADEIWAKDVLEHFPQADAGRLLDAWIRLLAPGGILHLKTPDLRALADFILNGTDSDEIKAYRVYGGQTYPENFHRAGFTVPALRAMLENRGMAVIEAKSHEGTNLLIRARKLAKGEADGPGKSH